MPSKKAGSGKAAAKVPAPVMRPSDKSAIEEAEVPVLPAAVATWLVGTWEDQFLTQYHVAASPDPYAFDVTTYRCGVKPRCTKALVRLQPSCGGFQILWGGKPGTTPKYVVKAMSANRITWSRPKEEKDFQWTKRAEVLDPTPAPPTVALDSESDWDARSEAESDYGLSDEAFAALGMKPGRTFDWPLSRADKKCLLAMRTQSILRSQLHQGIKEIQVLNSTIQQHEDTIKQLQKEVIMLREAVAQRNHRERSLVHSPMQRISADGAVEGAESVVYYIDPENEEMKIAYPTLLFDRNITDGRAMLCSILTLTIGNNQGMGDVEYGRIYDFYLPPAYLRLFDGPETNIVDMWRILGRSMVNGGLGDLHASYGGPPGNEPKRRLIADHRQGKRSEKKSATQGS